jgi:hypothetical protein
MTPTARSRGCAPNDSALSTHTKLAGSFSHISFRDGDDPRMDAITHLSCGGLALWWKCCLDHQRDRLLGRELDELRPRPS